MAVRQRYDGFSSTWRTPTANSTKPSSSSVAGRRRWSLVGSFLLSPEGKCVTLQPLSRALVRRRRIRLYLKHDLVRKSVSDGAGYSKSLLLHQGCPASESIIICSDFRRRFGKLCFFQRAFWFTQKRWMDWVKRRCRYCGNTEYEWRSFRDAKMYRAGFLEYLWQFPKEHCDLEFSRLYATKRKEYKIKKSREATNTIL